MSTASTSQIEPTERSEEFYSDEYSYKSLSRAAVLSLVFGILGLLSWYSPLLLFLSLLGAIFALIAFANFRKYPNEISGKVLAQIGLLISSVMLVSSPLKHAYVYYTELPDGYERISFAALKSPIGAPDVPPQTAIDLDGKKVFLKGYIHPTSLSSNAAKTFVLVPDWATCCFGQQPPLTHMIEVKLTGDEFASKSLRKHSLAGTLLVRPYKKPVDGLDGVYYELEADHFK
jgi:hypothetical protein